MKLTKIPTAVEFLEEFRALLGKITLEFAQKYAAICEVNPRYGQELMTAGASRNFVLALEKYGRGELNPRLLNESGRQYALLLKLPRSEQDRLLADGVEVLEANGDVRVIPVDELTPKQASQAIGKTLAQQKTWLIAHSTPPPRRDEDDVRFVKGAVIFKGSRIAAKTLALWLTQIP